MKLIVISDTHLDRHFDKRKYEFLKNILTECDRVIINGDFVDEWFTSYEEFIASEWKQLFPLLIDKQAIYLTGNHDYMQNKNAVGTFCVKQAISHEEEINGQLFHFEHGNLILDSMPKSRSYSIYTKVLEKKSSVVFYIIHGIERIMYFISPKSLRKSKFSHVRNLFIADHNKTSGWLVVGDTHYAEVIPDKLFANSGCIVGGFGSYLVIENGKIDLVDSNY